MAYTTIEEKLASYLTQNLTVKVYPLVKTEKDNNCVVYQKVSTVAKRTQSKSIYMNRTHFLLSAYSTTYSGVKGTVKKIWEKVDSNTSTFATSWISNEQDVIDIDSKLFRVDIDLYILWNDANLS